MHVIYCSNKHVQQASFISIAVDSQTLADIESTFKQFHSFLDFLGQNG